MMEESARTRYVVDKIYLYVDLETRGKGKERKERKKKKKTNQNYMQNTQHKEKRALPVRVPC